MCVGPVGLVDRTGRRQNHVGRCWLSVGCVCRPPAGLGTAPGGYNRLSRLLCQGAKGEVDTRGLRGLQDHEASLLVP